MVLEDSIIPTELLPSILDLLFNIQSRKHMPLPIFSREFQLSPKTLEVFIRENLEEFNSPLLMNFADKERQMHTSAFQSLCGPSKSIISFEDFRPASGNTFLSQTGLFNGLFRAFDLKGEKSIDLQHYLHGLSILLKGSETEQIDFAFRMLDNRRKGFLSPQDVKGFVETYGSLLPREKAFITQFTRTLLILMDPKSTGRISYATFKNVCLHNHEFISALSQGNGTVANNGSQTKGLSIGFHHEQWELMWHVMYGITQSVRHSEQQRQADMDSDDVFSQVERYTFPETSSPSASVQDTAKSTWTFVDVAPMMFRMIRERFGITSTDYLSALGIEHLLGHLLLGRLRTLRSMSSTGRSGSMFYVSPDNRFFIKTIPDEEDATFVWTDIEHAAASSCRTQIGRAHV